MAEGDTNLRDMDLELQDYHAIHTPEEMGKRKRTLSRKALQNAVWESRDKADHLHKKLRHIISSIQGENWELISKTKLHDLEVITEEFSFTLREIVGLYDQDKCGDYGDEAILLSENLILNDAFMLIKKIKSRQSDELSETQSNISHHSRRSRSSCVSRSSSARLRAVAEAAAARENAEYERIIAQKQLERKQREAEEQRRCAEHEKEMAILAADRNAAVAEAKLRAIDQAFLEDEVTDKINIPYVPNARSEERTNEWVQVTPLPKGVSFASDNRRTNYHHPPHASGSLPTNLVNYKATPCAFGHLATSTPFKDITGNQLIETLTSTNQQIVAGLARQNLPKCHPDTFSGDATLFHAWKGAFKAMISDADVLPEQELNYLRKFTSGDVQQVVDSYRKRQHRDPVGLLRSLWTELERRFGSAAIITNTLLERLQQAAVFNESDNSKLQEFADLCADVESQISCLSGLACLNFPHAIQPIAEKLPASLRSKWEREVAKYADRNAGAYPSFRNFSGVVQEQARIKNNPNILAGKISTKLVPSPSTGSPRRPANRKIFKTSATDDSKSDPQPEGWSKRNDTKHCLFHERDGHDLMECKVFNAKSLDEKTDWIKTARLCFRCLSDRHVAKDCKKKVKCEICGDERHIALLHKDKTVKDDAENVNAKCTAVCDENTGGLSCSKIVLVEAFNKARPNSPYRVYAIIDEQSNASLISTELADQLGAAGAKDRYYLSTCSHDREVKYGRRVTNICVRALSGTASVLPTLIECDSIPQDKREIPTPEVARRFRHLRDIASEIPPLDENADIHLLIGRDAPELLKVRAFKNGPRGAPWAQKLLLGWTVTGQVCFDLLNGPVHIQACRTNAKVDNNKTSTTPCSAGKPEDTPRLAINGKDFEMVPCKNHIKVTEKFTEGNRVSDDIFYSSTDDNEVDLSFDDRKFLKIMEKGIRKNENGNWEMPLPFRQDAIVMPNNRSQAVTRLNGLIKTLKRKPQMEKDYLEFMSKIIEKGHASPVPLAELVAQSGHVWYLPHFGVYHPKKPTQIRVVFDSSAEFQDISLNKVLLPGPDLMNSLLGVLIRFRKERVAVMSDVEQMFHSFHVDPNHRDFLRFLWFEDNDYRKQVIEYRMNVHLFGNGPSPAVATYGLRKTVDHGEERCSEETKNFVRRNFYVDDGLISLPTAEEAIDLITDAQAVLATCNLRLHKVVSNSIEVMEAFPTADRAKDIRDLDLRHDSLPAQRSLGVYWDLEKDTFTFQVSLPEKPFTRRGVLSTVNSVYDPLGLAAPVMLEGRKLLQQLVAMGKGTSDNAPLGWDDPLPDKLTHRWQCWRGSLKDLEKISIPRCYRPQEFGTIVRAELHAFCDASQDAIAAAVYLRLQDDRNQTSVSLVYGQAKVAPLHPTSIPRLELCGAVLATQAVQKVLKEIDIEIAEVTYYTDSNVVLGYITNESRRFYVYVANRVQLIRSVSTPDQWRHVESERNPADLPTRGVHPSKLMESDWLHGPTFLRSGADIPMSSEIDPVSEKDPELRKDITTCKTKFVNGKPRGLGTNRFSRFSSLASLQRAIASLIVKIKEFKCKRNDEDQAPNTQRKQGSPEPSSKLRSPTVEELKQAMTVVIRAAQEDTINKEVNAIASVPGAEQEQDKRLYERKRKSDLSRLDPFVDNDGILRVGGRLRRADLDYGEKHPILLPKRHHVSQLVVNHYHQKVHHQGRQITHGAIRQAGYWIIGGHSTVNKELSSCVPCRKSRGRPLEQRMADLPADRTEIGPPFTNVGFDVFGPWTIQTRKMRGGAANSKRWGLVFTCLASRAIHIEVLEAMDASAFICALRRFFALRGPAAILRCDRGTNFVGGKTELDEALKELDKDKIEKFITEQECEWKFSPPHASHFGGVWERQILTIRRVLDAMFVELGREQLTHELLVTLMAEVTAIVNARPIAAIPSDTDDPLPLSPSMLLTMKTRPLGPAPGHFIPTDLYARRRWRRVQYLADQFWIRWKREYLQNLQTRQKWTDEKRDLKEGDVVLVKEESEHRNMWPMGRVTEATKSEDGKVRKALIAVYKDGKRKVMTRPIKELILLIPVQSDDPQD